MKTITIGTYHMPITADLEQKFLEFYAYYSLPAAVRCRMDPRAKQHGWLWDDTKSALYDAWIEFLENSDITAEQHDQLCELVYEQDDHDITDQLELALELETA